MLNIPGDQGVASGPNEPVMPPEIEAFLRELENGAAERGD